MRNIFDVIEAPESFVLLLCALASAAAEYWLQAPF